MDRRTFSKSLIALSSSLVGGSFLMKQFFKSQNTLFAANNDGVNIKSFVFKDDGTIPNNKLPLLIYQNAVKGIGNTAADHIEQIFAANNWTNTWRWGISISSLS